MSIGDILLWSWLIGIAVNTVFYTAWLLWPPRAKHFFTPAVVIAVFAWPATLIGLGFITLAQLWTPKPVVKLNTRPKLVMLDDFADATDAAELDERLKPLGPMTRLRLWHHLNPEASAEDEATFVGTDPDTQRSGLALQIAARNRRLQKATDQSE